MLNLAKDAIFMFARVKTWLSTITAILALSVLSFFSFTYFLFIGSVGTYKVVVGLLTTLLVLRNRELPTKLLKQAIELLEGD